MISLVSGDFGILAFEISDSLHSRTRLGRCTARDMGLFRGRYYPAEPLDNRSHIPELGANLGRDWHHHHRLIRVVLHAPGARELPRRVRTAVCRDAHRDPGQAAVLRVLQHHGPYRDWRLVLRKPETQF